MENSNGPPRGPRSYLQIILVIVALLAVPLAWSGYSLHWIRKRTDARGPTSCTAVQSVESPVLAPRGLWVFGERGFNEIWREPGSPLSVAELGQLFPEAKVIDKSLSSTFFEEAP